MHSQWHDGQSWQQCRHILLFSWMMCWWHDVITTCRICNMKPLEPLSTFLPLRHQVSMFTFSVGSDNRGRMPDVLPAAVCLLDRCIPASEWNLPLLRALLSSLKVKCVNHQWYQLHLLTTSQFLIWMLEGFKPQSFIPLFPTNERTWKKK